MEKHELTSLLKTVSLQNFQTMELQDLANAYTRVLTAISYLDNNPSQFAGMLEKFAEIFEKIQEEFECRGVMIVNLFNAVESQPELVRDTLRAYSLLDLLELLANLEADDDESLSKAALFVKEEIVARAGNNPRVAN